MFTGPMDAELKSTDGRETPVGGFADIRSQLVRDRIGSRLARWFIPIAGSHRANLVLIAGYGRSGSSSSPLHGSRRKAERSEGGAYPRSGRSRRAEARGSR